MSLGRSCAAGLDSSAILEFRPVPTASCVVPSSMHLTSDYKAPNTDIQLLDSNINLYRILTYFCHGLVD